MDPQAHQASVLYKAALDDPREQGDVDVSAANQHCNFLPHQRHSAVDQSCEGCSARSFGQSFFALEQQKDGVGDLFFFDGNDVVHVLLNQRQGAIAGASDSDSICNSGSRLERHGLAFGDGNFHRRQARGLNSEDLYFGIRLFQRAGDAPNQPSATDRDDDGFEIGMLLDKLQADSALSGDDDIVIEGMNEGEVLGFTAADGLFESFVVVGAVQNYIRAVAARCRDLDERRGQGHANLGADAELAGMVGHALRVISGRGCDHTLGTFFGAEREQLVQRAALFESARALEVVELQIDGVGGGLGKGLRTRARRKVDGAANTAQGRLDVIESNHFLTAATDARIATSYLKAQFDSP